MLERMRSGGGHGKGIEKDERIEDNGRNEVEKKGGLRDGRTVLWLG